MKKILKVLCCIFIVIMNMNLHFISAKENEKESALILDTKTSGSRSVVLELNKRYFKKEDQTFKGGIQAVDQVIQNNKPEVMDYVKEEDEDSYFYTFKITFDSLDDYKNKIKTIVPAENEIEIEYKFPQSPFATGVSLKENFSNRDLLKWLSDALEETKVCEYFSSYSDLKNIKVYYDGKDYDSYQEVSVSKLEHNDISKIKMNSIYQDDQFHKVARTIQVWMSEETYKKNTKEIEIYLKDSIPDGGSGAWSQEISDSFWSDKKEYVFTITFEANSVEEIVSKTNKVLHSDKSTLQLEETEGENPFRSYLRLTEEFDVSAFGDERRVEVENTVTVMDNCKIKNYNSYYSNENEHIVETSTYDSTAKFDFEISLGYELENIDISTQIEGKDKIKKSWIYTYKDDVPKVGAEQLKDYFSQFSGFETKLDERDQGVVLEVSITGTPDEINTLLSDVFGNGNHIVYSVSNEKMTGYQTTFSESIDYSVLYDLLGYQESTVYQLTQQKGEKVKIPEVYSNQLSKNDGNYKAVFYDEFQTGYEGSVVLAFGVVLMMSAYVLVLLVFLGGYHYFKKKWLRALHQADLNWIEGNKQYLRHLSKAGQAHLNQTFHYLSGIFIPGDVDHQIYHYFNGNKLWLALAVIMIFIWPFLVAVFTTLPLLIYCFPYASIGLVVVYLYSRNKKNQIAEQKIDEMVKSSLVNLKKSAMESLGLIDEMLILDTIAVTGPAFESSERKMDISHLKPYQAALLKLIQGLQYHEFMKGKKGSDQSIRFNFMRYSYIFFTEEQILYYTYDQNMYTGTYVVEESCEYFFRDVVVADSGFAEVKVQNGKKFTFERISFLNIIGKSNYHKKLSIEVNNDILEKQFIAMKKLIKEKKIQTKEDYENEYNEK